MSEHKILIRRAGQIAGVPNLILSRAKRTFGISASRLAGPGGVIETLFRVDLPAVERDVLSQFLCADERRAMTGWTLINYEIWKRLLVNGEPVERLKAELEEGCPLTDSSFAYHSV